MVSPLKLFSFSSIVFAAGLLAGCGSSVPEATDEEIIALVGEARGTFSRDENAPLVIIKRTVECAEMLSGLNAEIIKDTPAEMLGMIKTECRQQFDRAVKDSARNTQGFKLEHFENKDFAKRIAVAAEKSEELYKAYEIKRKEEEEKRRAEERAQRLAETEKKLATERAEFEKSLVGYEELANALISLCTERGQTINSLQARGEIVWQTMALFNCKYDKEEILEAADKNRTKWAEVEIVESSISGAYYNKPYIIESGLGTKAGLEVMIDAVKDDLDQLKRRLNEN